MVRKVTHEVMDAPAPAPVAAPESVTVEVVEPKAAEPQLNEKTKAEMAEGRKMLEKFK